MLQQEKEKKKLQKSEILWTCILKHIFLLKFVGTFVTKFFTSYRKIILYPPECQSTFLSSTPLHYFELGGVLKKQTQKYYSLLEKFYSLLVIINNFFFFIEYVFHFTIYYWKLNSRVPTLTCKRNSHFFWSYI